MPYGTVKLDTIIYTSGGLDASTAMSGLVGGNFSSVSSSGTISGASGVFTVVSGTSGVFTVVSGTSGVFTVVSGTSGVFTGTVSGSSGVFAASTLTDPAIVGTVREDIYTIADGAAFEIDPGNGSIQLITLGASRTPKATNFVDGEAITFMVDDGTAYTLTWTDATFGASGVAWKTDGGVAPTLNVSGYTAIVLWKVSGQVYGARVGDA
jgi:hypothetical protein